MGKEGIKGVFGKPDPLRNKAVKASDRLEEDAHAMEARLLQLKVTMLEEKQKREAELPLKHAGNRWRSAREDRGSMRQYARDVQRNKQSKKNLTENARLSSRTKPSKSKKSSSRSKNVILSPTTVEQWTVPQVVEWLKTIGLEEFQSGFEFHQVTGKVLLGLATEGYEKLGVFKLSARNRLLAEMEQIKAHRERTRSRSQDGSTESTGAVDSKSRCIQAAPENSSPVSKLAAKTHWSHVAPLSEKVVANKDGQDLVNLADGDYNEDASHASFMKAVLEWRESDSTVKSNQEEEEWVNPMFDSGDTNEQYQSQIGGALLEGTYSEEKAHQSFQEALSAWRNGGRVSATTNVATSVEQTDSGCMPGERKSCWQCYHVVQLENVVHDEQTDKSFCGLSCQNEYRTQYARFYTSH